MPENVAPVEREDPLAARLRAIEEAIVRTDVRLTIIQRALAAYKYVTDEDMKKFHTQMVVEAKQQQDQQHADGAVPSAEGIRTANDKLPSENAPEEIFLPGEDDESDRSSSQAELDIPG